jgi:hypothetical protein
MLGDGRLSSLLLPCVCVCALLQAVLRSNGNQVWEKGDNHKAKLQGSQDVSLYHEFRA